MSCFLIMQTYAISSNCTEIFLSLIQEQQPDTSFHFQNANFLFVESPIHAWMILFITLLLWRIVPVKTIFVANPEYLCAVLVSLKDPVQMHTGKIVGALAIYDTQCVCGYQTPFSREPLVPYCPFDVDCLIVGSFNHCAESFWHACWIQLSSFPIELSWSIQEYFSCLVHQAMQNCPLPVMCTLPVIVSSRPHSHPKFFYMGPQEMFNLPSVIYSFPTHNPYSGATPFGSIMYSPIHPYPLLRDSRSFDFK